MVRAFLFSVLLVQSALAQTTPRVTPGAWVLFTDSLDLILGKRVGLITNHTARDQRGRSTIDLMFRAPGGELTALFAPEHGLVGAVAGGKPIPGTTTIQHGMIVPVYSLYGETRVPSAEALSKIDVLLYDIQDIGARMYTYVWTMTLAAEAAKKAGKKFIVLDRPNPIRADIVEGGSIDRRYRSFTGLHEVPVRYGLTPGELARYLQSTGRINADVTVIPMKGYSRSMWWDETGLEWIPPSPNIRDVEAALLYPGMAFFEATNLSEGRGTSLPFRVVGARWLTDAASIARAMNYKRLGGVQFESTRVRIARGQKFGGETIPMVRLVVTNRDSVRSTEVAAHLLREIYRRHPREFRWKEDGIELLSGSASLRLAVERGGIEKVLDQWRAEAARFQDRVAPYRLYPMTR